jgi:hypothetical protein
MNIFTYGSLMFPSVLKAVTGREFAAKKARVKNCARFRVKGESLTAQTYAIKAEYRDRLSSKEWDPTHFEKADLLEFMASYRAFHRTDRSDRTDPTDQSDPSNARRPLHLG